MVEAMGREVSSRVGLEKLRSIFVILATFSPSSNRRLQLTILSIVLICSFLPVQCQQLESKRHSQVTASHNNSQSAGHQQLTKPRLTQRQADQKSSGKLLKSSSAIEQQGRQIKKQNDSNSESGSQRSIGGIAIKPSERSLLPDGELTSRIASLDDLSHRLDQTRENVSQEMDDTRVPFWNIAHMINSIEQVDLALGSGSNGIETDVSFDANGLPQYAYHGVPCDCGRHCFHQEDLVKFIKYLAYITNPPASNRLFLVLFDLKLKDLKSPQQKETAGMRLAELLHKHLFAPYQAATSSVLRSNRQWLVQPPLRVVVSINHASDILLVKSFINYMRSNRLDFMSQQVGFDVGMNDNLTEISQAWDQLNGATSNIWQGDGLTNCLNIVRSTERLKQALRARNDQGHFRKVYFWTVDIMYHIRSVLRLGLDAILTNTPQRVNQVLNEPEFRTKYRLATPYDDPFQQYHISPSSWRFTAPTVGELVETIANIKETSSNFIKTLPDGLSAVINRVHH